MTTENSLRKRMTTAINAVPTTAVFFFFDILDEFLCIVFKILDEILEGNSDSCYCTNSREMKFGFEDVEALSETLFRRRNVFRNMGLLRFAKKPDFPKKMGIVSFLRKLLFSGKMKRGGSRGDVGGLKNRWSDCGCEMCVSWMKNDKLHVVVKTPSSQDLSKDKKIAPENVIFIHGFMGSSSFWTKTVFKHLSKHATNNYRFFAVDLLGFGNSPKPRNNLYTLRDHVEMIEKSVVLSYDLSSFHVVAHSMGCVIAVALAAKYSNVVKSVTLLAPPYFPNSSKKGASLAALDVIAEKRLWPPSAFFTAMMSWYEHVGRCVCFIICRHHRTWERLIKILTRKRDLSPLIMDMTKHTHHSAWHSMHNVICAGAKFTDKHLEILTNCGIRICVMQGDHDIVVPIDCCRNMKMKFPAVEVEVIAGADHRTIVTNKRESFTAKIENLWASFEKKQNGSV